MKRIVLAAMLCISCNVNAGVFDYLSKKISSALDKLVVPASVDFRNETDNSIYVVMDSDREHYVIAAHGQATFKKANVWDKPTFYVYRRPSEVEVLYSRQVDPLPFHSSLGWHGKF